jgi:amidohydrolase
MARAQGRLLFMSVLIAANASAQSTIASATLDDAVGRVSATSIQARHQIHQSPELGNREFKTAELIASHLRLLGIEVRTGIAHTGVVGILRGRRSGRVVALRADMDALPITEDTPFPFKSTVRTTYRGQEVGVSHACGHDIHVAVMLGVASVLAPMRDSLTGTVMFIFQPAEEGAADQEPSRGAALMLKEGVFSDPHPNVIFGLHSLPEYSVGQIAYTSGPTNAATSIFTATLTGKSAHPAWPNLSVDPIVMAAQAILALQTIRARNLSPLEPSVIRVTQVHSSGAGRAIPEEVQLEGTVRTFNDDVDAQVEGRMREILDGVARSAGGSYRLEYRRLHAGVNISNPALVDRMVPILERTLGKENVMRVPPIMAGDDFSEFAKEIPGMFFFLGIVKPGTTSGPNHTPNFLADDSAIPVGIRAVSAMVLDYLK